MRSIHQRQSLTSTRSGPVCSPVATKEHKRKLAVAEALEGRRLLSATLAPPGTLHPEDVTSQDGRYPVREAWSVTVTDPYTDTDGNPKVFTRTGVAAGTIDVTDGSFELINKTGTSVGSLDASIDYDGSEYTVTSQPVLYAFGSKGRGFFVVAKLSFFTVLVPLPSNFGFSLFGEDDQYTATSDGSTFEGAGTAVDGNGEEFDVSSVATVGGGQGPGPANNVSEVLTPSIAHCTLPPAVVAGSAQRGGVVVNVANSGGASLGETTVDVYASADGSIDDASVLIGSITKRKLGVRANGKVAVTVPIKSLPGSLDGSYTLLAEVTDPSANTVDSDTGPALSVAPPFIAFSEKLIQTNLASIDVSGAKTRATVRFDVKNTGNTTSNGTSQIGLFVSSDGIAGDGTLIRSVRMPVVLKPGASRVITVPLLDLPAVSHGNYKLVAQITDPDSNVTQIATTRQYMLAAPFVSLVPSRGSMVTAHSGTAIVSFTVTNEGNVEPVGSSTIALYASPDGKTDDGSLLLSQPQSLPLLADKSRVLRIHLTSAQRLAAADAGMLAIEVTDPHGRSQTLAISV